MRLSFSDFATYLSRALAATLAGSLLYAAFDYTHPIWWLALVALIPLEWAIRTVRPLEAYCWGFLTFWVFLSSSLWWLERWGVASVLGLTFMEASAYAIAIGFYAWLRDRLGRDPYHLLLPACIILVEFKRNVGFWAFPWPMLGHALVYSPVMLQSAALIGVMGLGFWVIWSNALFASLALDRFIVHGERLRQVRPWLWTTAFMVVYGVYSLMSAPWIEQRQAGTGIPATFTQRTSSTLSVWDWEFQQLAARDYLGLTPDHLKRIGLWRAGEDTVGPPVAEHPGPRGLTVWPENAIPYAYNHGGEIQRFVDESGQVLIYGSSLRLAEGDPPPWSPEFVPLTFKTAEEIDQRLVMGAEPAYYNTVELRVPGGRAAQALISKYHLVPLAESVPMRRYISLIENPWGPGASNMRAGQSLKPFETPFGKVGVVICYESFFAPIVRKLVQDGATILVLASNTSWFEDRIGATYQHAYYDRVRAVENRIPYVRAATTGVSSIIDPWGRELEITIPFDDWRNHLPVPAPVDAPLALDTGIVAPGPPPETVIVGPALAEAAPATAPAAVAPEPVLPGGEELAAIAPESQIEGICGTAIIYPRQGLSVYTVLGDWVVGVSALGLLAALLSLWYPEWRRAAQGQYGVWEGTSATRRTV